MKKIIVLFILVLFAFGQANAFAHDRHHGHFDHHRHHPYVVRYYGGYYPPPYYHYNVDGTALVLGTALVGVSLVNGVVGAITSPFTTPFTEGTKRIAITEEHRTKREEIRSNTVLNTPSALAGNGNAEYVSTEGSARISASTSSGHAVSRDETKKCSKEQLKQGRIGWGTSGKLRNLTTGETCSYDLR